uniref:Saposin B-type domain-containing protein n=1 Tax=Parastrongyloides trichosuri TaxID=131310 RepID=A0A0N5A2S7_PARTI
MIKIFLISFLLFGTLHQDGLCFYCEIINVCNKLSNPLEILRCSQNFIDQYPYCGEDLKEVMLPTQVKKRLSPFDEGFGKRNFKVFQQLRQLQRIPVGKRENNQFSY